MLNKKFFVGFFTLVILVLVMPISLSVCASEASPNITTTKTATPVPGCPGQWNICIDIARAPETTTDVVLLIDRSNSMSGCLSAAQGEADKIIDDLAGCNVNLGIIAFSSSSSITNFSNLTGETKDTFKGTIKALTCSGIADNGTSGADTDLQKALNYANNMLSQRDQSGKKAIVLLSDGQVNIYSSTKGSSNFSTIANNTKSYAQNLQSVYSIYSVGFFTTSDPYNGKYAMLLSNCANKGYSVLSSVGSNADLIANSISGDITNRFTGAVVTDTIGPEFDLVDTNGDSVADGKDCAASVGSVSLDPSAAPGTLRWSIGDISPNQSLTLNYQVKIKDDAVSGQTYPTGLNSILTYNDFQGQAQTESIASPSVSIGKVTVNYSCEQRDGTFKSLGSNTYTFPVDSSFTLSGDERDAKLNSTDLPSVGNYNSADTSVSSTSVVLDPSHPTNPLSIDVKYKLKRTNVSVKYYRDSLDPANQITDLAPTSYFASNVPVTTPLPADLALILIQLNKLKPDSNYGDGIVASVPSVVSSDSTGNVIKILYLRIQPGLSVVYDFEGGPLAGSTSCNYIDNDLGAGSEINLDHYKLNTGLDTLKKYHYISSALSPDGLAKASDGNSILPNVGGTVIVLTYQYDQALITVNQSYPDESSGVTHTLYQDTPYSLSDLVDADDQGGRFTHVVLISPAANYSASGGSISFIGDTTVTVNYTRVTKVIKVVHRYPDGTELTGKSVSENYLAEGLDPMTYYRQVQFETMGGKFKFNSYSDTAPFTLTDDKTLYINYSWGDAVIKVIHDYPDQTDVTEPDHAVHFNDRITLGNIAFPQTDSGAYEVSGYRLRNESMQPSDQFTVNGVAYTITIVYKNAQAGITVVHHYPADSGKTDIADEKFYQNVGSIVDLSKIKIRNDDARFVFDSFSPGSIFTLTCDGLTVTVNYKWATANLRVNFVGQTIAADGKIVSSEPLDSENITGRVGSEVSSSDFAKGRSFQEYTYKYSDPLTFIVSSDGCVVTIIYTKPAPTNLADNTIPKSGTPGSNSTTSAISDNNTPKSENPSTGGDPVQGSLQALLLSLLSGAALIGGSIALRKYKNKE